MSNISYEANEYPLTLEQFTAILKFKDKYEIVGDQTLTGSNCIANVLKEIDNCKASVMTDYTIYDQWWFTNPTWVKEFNQKIGVVATNYYKVTAEEILITLGKLDS